LGTRIKVIFLGIILLAFPAVVSPNILGEPGNNNANPNAPGQIKKVTLDDYPDTTPVQEHLKKTVDNWKNGDPNKPKENNDQSFSDINNSFLT